VEVPYLDLRRQYLRIKDEIDNAIQETLDSCAFVAGEKVKKFEADFAKYCGVKYAIGISSGTSSLYVGLKALGIGKGDGVITVPFTFIATTEAITYTGARPIFVDIQKDSYNISTDKIENYIKQSCIWNEKNKILLDRKNKVNIKAIIPVHLYGQPADMDEIMDIANHYNLFVLEDAAQAHGATYKNNKAGSIGHIGMFSFYPSKNLGAYGQGGAVITNHRNFDNKIRMFIDHGQKDRYSYAFEGWNYKMDGFQAAILDVKLHHLDKWNRERNTHVKYYNELLKDIEGLILPKEKPYRTHVYHVYTICVENRDSFQKYMQRAGIGTSKYYPTPLHLQDAYQYLGYKTGDFPNAEECAGKVLSLPLFPELNRREIEYVCENIKKWFKNHK
jgi:dTDP-4-amino-4,6-dideoxygalactose transaminase